MVLGGVSHFHEKYFYNESLNGPYGLGEFFLLVGILMVVYLIWKRKTGGEN